MRRVIFMYGGRIYKHIPISSILIGTLLIVTLFSGFPTSREQGTENTLLVAQDDGMIENPITMDYLDTFIQPSSIPISGFVENIGQIEDQEIYFSFQDHGISVGFLESAYVVILPGSDDSLSVVRITFPGSHHVSPSGEQAMDHPTTFIRGADQEQWIQGITSFSQLVYRDLYSGIDLVFTLHDEGVKYDWIMHPFADPGLIAQRYHGDALPILHADGSLTLSTPTGTLTEDPPKTFQETDQGLRINILSEFRAIDGATIGFRVGDYDPSWELIIDPLLSTTLFGSYLTPIDMVLDDEDNIYLVGSSFMENFPTTPGTYYKKGTNWFSDLFFCKFNRRMSRLVFAGIIGGDCHDIATTIALDPNGDIIISGNTRSSDFPVTSDAVNHSIDFGGNAGFLMRISSNGSQLRFSTLIPWGPISDMVLTGDGIPYLMGTNSGAAADLPTTPGCYDNETDSSPTAYILKFNYHNRTTIYATYLGGSSQDSPSSMSMDRDGNIYLTGTTGSPDFPTTPGCFNGNHSSDETIFISKLDPTLCTLMYSTFIDDVGFGMYTRTIRLTIDRDGHAIISGSTLSDSFFVTEGCADDTYGGSEDIYLTKVNHNGTGVVFSTYLSGNDTKWERTRGIAIDERGYIIIAGETNSEEFPVTPGCYQGMFGGGGGIHGMGDCFLAVFTPNGFLEYSTYVGGSGEEFTSGIDIDSDGNAVVAAYFRTSPQNFPLIPGGYSMNGGTGATALFKLLTSPRALAFIDSVTPNPALNTDAIQLIGHTTSDSPVIRYVWTVDGEEVHNGTGWKVVIPRRDPGIHTIGFRVLNEAGYWSKEANTEIIVHTRPAAIIDFLAPNPTLDTLPVNLSGYGSDDGEIIEYSWRVGLDYHNGTDPWFILPCSQFPMIPPQLPAISIPIGFRVRDDHGIWSSEIRADLLVVSRPKAIIDPPDRTIFAPDEPIPITGSCSDDRTISRFEWTSSLDGLLSMGTEPAITINGLSTGEHVISLRVQDQWGFLSNSTLFHLKITDRPIAHITTVTPNPALISDVIEFTGTGTDDNMVTNYSWTSSLDGMLQEGSNPFFSGVGLSLGTHIITFRVQDNDGFWSDSDSCQLTITEQPVAIIDTFSQDVLAHDEYLHLMGNGTDDRSIVLYAWSSSRDGDLDQSLDPNLSLTGLSVGDHTIALRVCDDHGFWSDPVSVTLTIHRRPIALPPTIGPSPTILGQSVTFQGTGADDGELIGYRWTSDIDGVIGEKPEFSLTNLSKGIHTISFRVMDNHECWSHEVITKLIIMSRPVSIITNVSHEVALAGETIFFRGYASDDGTIQEYCWRSSIDGVFGNGKSCHHSALSPGVHEISYRARDEQGLWSDPVFRQVIVHEPPTARILSIGPGRPTTGDVLILAGGGRDDGTITCYVWRSSVDGELYNGTWEEVRSAPLSFGEHTITLRVQDDHGIWSEEVSVFLEITGEVEKDEGSGIFAQFLAVIVVLGVLVGFLAMVTILLRSKSGKGT